MTIAQTVSQVKPSLTMAITAQAKAMKADGVDVISLSAGEPDFQTPAHICDAAIKAINDGFTRYTPASGTPELKKSLSRFFERENSLTYGIDQIIANCGAKHSVYLALMAIIDPGDEVLVPAPYWVSYPDMATLCGGVPVFLETSSDTGLKITPKQLKAALTDKTKALILNSPSNPTGVIYTEDELREIAKVLEGTKVIVISDEIYQKLIYDGNVHCPFASLSDDAYNRTVTIYGVSKTYAMTGWRIGCAAGPKDIIKAMGTIQSQQTSNPCSISQKAAVAAFDGPQAFLNDWVGAFSERREYVTKRLNAVEGVSCIVPGGAFYVFPDVSSVYESRDGDTVIDGSLALSNYLLNAKHIATVPGIGFGNDNHIRISYASSLETLATAMDRFESGIQELKS